ncbi:hypothetical protein EPA93_33605 [Ktedonosporobacter rubrisoli]|uniref:Uncharacterized protein n=1 Tax=Ktedonosporobacter rubrisoli TaxID=2509675 RepID=A0A4P6K6M9_KTERU|nr:hypothetical protein EPA93_33605 [Ktedonosporobacter rubrisoli]
MSCHGSRDTTYPRTPAWRDQILLY